jgi:hypothetical protein
VHKENRDKRVNWVVQSLTPDHHHVDHVVQLANQVVREFQVSKDQKGKRGIPLDGAQTQGHHLGDLIQEDHPQDHPLQGDLHDENVICVKAKHNHNM